MRALVERLNSWWNIWWADRNAAIVGQKPEVQFVLEGERTIVGYMGRRIVCMILWNEDAEPVLKIEKGLEERLSSLLKYHCITVLSASFSSLHIWYFDGQA